MRRVRSSSVAVLTIALIVGIVGARTLAGAAQTAITVDIDEQIGVQHTSGNAPATDTTATEVVAVADATAVQPALQIDIQESITGSADTSPTSNAVTLAETATVSDELVAMPAVMIDVTEGIGVSDASGATGPPGADVSETIVVSDVTSVVAAVMIDVTEGIGVSDASGAAGPPGADVNETIVVSDVTSVVAAVMIDVTEGIGVSDASGVAGPPGAEVNETIVVSDAVSVVPAVSIDVVEAIGVSDGASASNTPAGGPTSVVARDTATGTSATLSFANVTSPGTTSLTTSSAGPPPPLGFSGLSRGTTYYEITTTATFVGPVRVCLADGSVTAGSRLFHRETSSGQATWVDRTGLPVVPPTICAEVTSFSPFAVFSDVTPPSITISSPGSTTYLLRQAVLASYACLDDGTGLATCQGTVASGARVDTSSVGTKTFTVDATDRAGNVARRIVTYVVAYRICAITSTRTERGAGGGGDASDDSRTPAIHVSLRLCAADGANVSSRSVAVTAVGLDGGALPGNKPRPIAFTFDPEAAGYKLTLRASGLTTGAHVLRISVAGDPAQHDVPFTVAPPRGGDEHGNEPDDNFDDTRSVDRH